MSVDSIIGIVLFGLFVCFIGPFGLFVYYKELKKNNKSIDEFNKRFNCHLNYDDDIIEGLCNTISALQAEINSLNDIIISSSEVVVNGKDFENK